VHLLQNRAESSPCRMGPIYKYSMIFFPIPYPKNIIIYVNNCMFYFTATQITVLPFNHQGVLQHLQHPYLLWLCNIESTSANTCKNVNSGKSIPIQLRSFRDVMKLIHLIKTSLEYIHHHFPHLCCSTQCECACAMLRTGQKRTGHPS
jgi:hypothetical protein